MKEITNLGEAAKLCKSSERSISRWIQQGLFPQPIREIGKARKTRAWRRKDILTFPKKLEHGQYPRVPLR